MTEGYGTTGFLQIEYSKLNSWRIYHLLVNVILENWRQEPCTTEITNIIDKERLWGTILVFNFPLFQFFSKIRNEGKTKGGRKETGPQRHISQFWGPGRLLLKVSQTPYWNTKKFTY
jgi:hypothetical protein